MFRYKKSVIFLVLGSLIFAIFGGGKLPYFVLCIVIFTVLISYFWTRSVVSKLTVRQKTVSDSVNVGDRAQISTMVFNGSLLPAIYVEIKNEMIKNITGKDSPGNVIYLMPFDSKRVTENFICKYRGRYNFGPVTVSISDVFGLFTWEIKVKLEGTFNVYPKVVKLSKFSTRSAQVFGTVTTKQNANEDYSSISDIRKYYPGDSLRKIHWKVSARKGLLYVKNYEMTGSAEAHVFLNLYKYDYSDIYRMDAEEKSVECAISVVYFMLREGVSTMLYANSKKQVYTGSRDLSGFKNFMEELINVKSDGEEPFEELLELRSRLISRGSTVILITCAVYDALINRIIQLKEIGFDVILVYTVINDISEKHLKIISHYDIKLYKVGLNDDVKMALEG